METGQGWRRWLLSVWGVWWRRSSFILSSAAGSPVLLVDRQGPKSSTGSSLILALSTDCCLSFSLYLYPPPQRAGEDPSTQPSCLVPRMFALPQSQSGVLARPRQVCLLAPENCDPLSCQADLNTVPAGTLPLPCFIQTSTLLLWPTLSPGPSPRVGFFFWPCVSHPPHPPASQTQALRRRVRTSRDRWQLSRIGSH